MQQSITNVRPSSVTKNTNIKGQDISCQILRQIFGTNHDFKTPIICSITPEIARRLLDYNTNNRGIRKRHVNWLSKQMELGYWIFTGDSIKFNSDGVLCDKQHTLHAIIQSNTTQKYIVIGGLDSRAMDVLDTGIARSAGDVLKLNGITNANNLAAICRRVLAFKEGKKSMVGKYNAGTEKNAKKDEYKDVIANIRILEEVTNDRRYVDALHIAEKCYGYSRLFNMSQYGVLYFLFAEKNADDAWEFLSKIATGVGLDNGSPILLLRQRLEQERDGRMKFSDQLKTYYIFTCWNKFRKGEVMKILQTPASIEIPELI
jgi:hypothetical protein